MITENQIKQIQDLLKPMGVTSAALVLVQEDKGESQISHISLGCHPLQAIGLLEVGKKQFLDSTEKQND